MLLHLSRSILIIKGGQGRQETVALKTMAIFNRNSQKSAAIWLYFLRIEGATYKIRRVLVE